MKIISLALKLSVLCTALCTASALAQRSGAGSRGERPIDIRSERSANRPGYRPEIGLAENNRIKSPNGMSTYFFSAEVVNVNPENRQIEIRRKSDKSDHMLGVAPDCKIKADEKQFGKKELSLDEIEPGYRVELLLELRTNQVTQIKVKKPKA